MKNTEGMLGAISYSLAGGKDFPECLGYTDNRDKLIYTLIYIKGTKNSWSFVDAAV